MKTVCFITDCSVDSALTLRRWVADHADETLRMTVILPYGVESGLGLNKETCRTAKQQATARLDHWLTMLPESLRSVKSETLFSSPELALKLCLLLRHYDYVLFDDEMITVPIDFLSKQPANLHRLNISAYSLQPV